MRIAVPFFALLLIVSPATSAPMPGMYDDIGSFHRATSTRNPAAAKWFDQGLVLQYAFNHEEAIRCFTEAARADSTFAMAWWGIACASGPHINNPTVSAQRDSLARIAIRRAQALVAGARQVEKALIAAQAGRWGEAPVADRHALDVGYADAMREVWRRFPKDADVGALTAEAVMDLQPWDLWTRAGQPKGAALEVEAILEKTLRLSPSHPMACHLYIHAMEASPFPGRASRAADALVGQVPGSGHMEHMPSHIYIRTGRIQDGIRCNLRAMRADLKHRRRQAPTGFIQVYVAHDAHFLAFANMLAGNSTAAHAAADSMFARLPAEFVEQSLPFADGFLPVAYHVMVRFGEWDAILKSPGFPDNHLVSNAVHHYARGVAHTALRQLDAAERELAAVDSILAHMDDRYIGNNAASVVLRVPRGLLAGELAFARGEREQGLRLAAGAVAVEDSLLYDEPPDWMMPARHSYGAMLLEARQWRDAEVAFREDLKMYPENGWSLFGLTRALRAQGRERAARAVERRFRSAWAHADVHIEAPCMCQPGTGPKVGQP